MQFHVNISCELFYFNEILGLVREFLITTLVTNHTLYTVPIYFCL